MTTMSHSKKGGKTPRKPLCKVEKVKIHILSGRSITGKEAMQKFGLYRLSSVIFRMRKDGHNVVTIPVTKNGETFAKYRLAKPPMSPYPPPSPLPPFAIMANKPQKSIVK